MSASSTRPFGLGKLQRARDRCSRVWIVYGCLGAALAAYLVLLLSRPLGASSTLIDGWGVDAFELIASALCIASGLRRRSGAAVPLILGAGLASWSLGDLVLTVESLGGVRPAAPSLADAFYFGFFLLAYIALVLLLRGEATRLSPANWLDGAVAGLGAGALCAAFAFSAIQRSTGDSPLAVVINLAYPVGDVLLLLLVVGGTAVMAAGTNKVPWLVVAVGIAANVFGDTANLLHASVGSSLPGTVADDIAWPTSILLMSAAMWLGQGRRDPLALARTRSFTLPGIAAALGLGILFIGTLDPINHVATALAAATLLLVVGRTGFSVHSLRVLTRERQRMAVTDHLTGLGNRRRLFDVLDGFFAETPSGAERLAFLFIDLDGFKQVNDSFGHPVGDEVLKRVSARLADSLRGSDLLTRVGGDEFGAILMDAGAREATDAACRLSASLKDPFTIESVTAQIGVSIGIALAPADADDSAGLVWCSDVAMYRAKLASSPFAFYEQDFDDAGNRLALADDLRLAIDSGQLVLHYQPQLDLRTREITTLEALIRWQHPGLGLVAPLKFLPLAEEAGLMGALTEWVLARALGQCAAWRREGRSLTVSVNMSTTDLLGAGFVELVAGLLVEHGLPAGALVLEITETTIIREFERSRQVVWRLRELGVLVSIDDFGAGFTSLAYLSGLAVGELKLDRTFITPLAGEIDARAVELVRATIELGHALRLRVVAEGVEDAATLGLLRRLDCDVAQGDCIGKPAPPHKVTFWSVPAAVPALLSNGSGPGSDADHTAPAAERITV